MGSLGGSEPDTSHLPRIFRRYLRKHELTNISGKCRAKACIRTAQGRHRHYNGTLGVISAAAMPRGGQGLVETIEARFRSR